MKKIKLFMVMGLIATMLSACGASSSSLVGRWQVPDSSQKLEFFSDGTYDSSDANYSGGYSVDGNRIRLSGILMPDKTYTFSVSGNTLTFYNDDGKPMQEYKKVN